VKYADGLVILTKEETVLQGMIAKLSKIGRCFGIKINVEKLRTISRQISPIQTTTDQKQPANVEYLTIGVARKQTMQDVHVKKISMIAMEKAALNKNKVFFTRKLDLNLRQKLLKCYIGCTTLHGAEKWILRKLDKKLLQSF
jgi:hypothetical protein